MRYFYKRPEIFVKQIYGQTYKCDHPLYDECTLYLKDGNGISVVQNRFDMKRKMAFYGPLDGWLANDIYLNPNFINYFKEHATKPTSTGLYFTCTARQIMWALRMKPLKKEWWEEASQKLQRLR